MNSLLETIAAELERPRTVSQQVIRHIVSTYDVPREDIGTFLVAQLPQLEDHEVDLVLSPLFTPSLEIQSIFAELLGQRPFKPELWPQTIANLAERPTRANLVTEDDKTHAVTLRAVTLERFVLRLRLEGSITDDVFELLRAIPQDQTRAVAKAVARRAVWEHAGRREILKRFLQTSADKLDASDLAELLKLVENYTPADIAELSQQIPHWQQILRQEINSPASRQFLNERVEELHGGGRDQRRGEDPRLRKKQAEFEFLERLKVLLAQ